MISFKLNSDWDVSPIDNGSGLLTLETSTYPVTNSQLVPLTVFTPRKGREFEPTNAIDWEFFFGSDVDTINEPLLNLFATQLQAAILNVAGVTSVDLSNAQIDIENRSLVFNGVCFNIDCNEFNL